MSWKFITEYPDRITHIGQRLVLHCGDYANNGARCMLSDTDRIAPGLRQKFKMRFRVPTGGFPDTGEFDVLVSQWRQEGSPQIRLGITGQCWTFRGAAVDSPIELADLVPDTEIEFLFDIRFALKDDGGYATCCVNGEQVLDWKGDTIRPVATEVHWSTGLYRPQWNDGELPEGDQPNRVLDVLYLERLDGKGGPCD